MCPYAAQSPDGKSSGDGDRSGVRPPGLQMSVTKHDEVSRSAIESPGQSYAQSETRLFGYLFTHPEHLASPEVSALLGRLDVQQVLARQSACKFLEKKVADPQSLHYLAHVYNCALGMDFQVCELPHGSYFFSDGALRRVLEDLQEQEKFKDDIDARAWAKSKLDRFLLELQKTLPQLESFLLKTAPQSPDHHIVNATGKRLQPLYVHDIVIPTANRPKETARLLNSLSKNFAFYGYDAQQVQISVVDTSSSPEMRLATLDAVEQAQREGLRVEHVGPSAMHAKLSIVSRQLSGEARTAFEEIFLRGLFSENREEGIPITIGTVRNAVSFIMAGRPYISLDDDMMLDAVVPTMQAYQEFRRADDRSSRGFDLHVGAANDYVNFATLKQSEFVSRCTSVPADILGIACRNLDAPIYVTESRLVGSPEYSPFIKPKGHVSVVRPYISNASPDVTVFLRNFMKSGDVAELTGAKAPAYVPVEAPASCLFRGYSSGTMFATSSSLRVPFLDARAYEDVAQSQLTEFFNPHDVQFQGGTIEHRRSVGSRVLNSVNYVDTLIGFYSMSRYLSNVYPESFVSRDLMRESDPARALRKIGRRMYVDGIRSTLADSDIREFSRAYLQMGKRLRENRVEGAATFSILAADIEREIRNRHAVFLRTNGQLYYFWGKFAAAARRAAGASED